MRFPVFSYSPSFPIKMHATDAKTQKIEPDPNFFWRTKVSEAVCKRNWHNVRSYLFFNVWKFRTQCAETLTQKRMELVNKVIIFVFFAHKMYSRKLRLKHWCHMDYFNNVITAFLGLERGSCTAVYEGSESSQISSKISYGTYGFGNSHKGE